MGQARGDRAPAVEIADQRRQRAARGRLQLVGHRQRAGGLDEAEAARAAGRMDLAQGGVADAAARLVDDALEGEVVGGLMDQAQIGERVADLLALVEAQAAQHAIGQAQLDEALLEFAGLEAGAHQDRDLAQRRAAALQGLDLLADLARLLLAVPDAADADLVADLAVGMQRLAEPALVMGDQPGGGGQDMAGGAVVALEPDDLGAGKIALEAQDVADLRARASHRSTGRRRRRSRGCAGPGPGGAATDTARHWCPGTRPPGCSGTAADTGPGPAARLAKSVRLCSSRSPKSQAFRLPRRS